MLFLLTALVELHLDSGLPERLNRTDPFVGYKLRFRGPGGEPLMANSPGTSGHCCFLVKDEAFLVPV